jgi:lysophospholipase L1-like esterase
MERKRSAVTTGLAVCLGLAACAGSEPPAPPARIVYLALGASDAQGVGAEPLTRGYVYRIAAELDRRVDQVFLANLGIPGGDTAAIAGGTGLFFEAEAAPDLVTVWTGPNDLIRGGDADGFEDALAPIFERLRDANEAAVIVAATVPDLTRLPRFRAEPDEDVTRERIEEFNAAIEEQAEDYGVLVVDLYGEPVADELVSEEDGFHPNDEGHRRIAARFLRVILPAFGLVPVA